MPFFPQMKADKLKAKLLKGNVSSWSFDDACLLARHCGWKLSRTKGSHHIFTHPKSEVNSINLQNEKGDAKEYQLRQMKAEIESHGL